MSQDDNQHHFTLSIAKSLLPRIFISQPAVEREEFNCLDTTLQISTDILRLSPKIVQDPLIAEDNLTTEQADIILPPHTDSDTDTPNFDIVDDQDSDSIEDILQAQEIDDNLQDNLQTIDTD